jgi:lipopolysaccharide biosynthesis glycosyltransferase
MGPFIFILRILLSLVEGVIKRLILALAYNLQSNVMLTVARAQLHEVQKKTSCSHIETQVKPWKQFYLNNRI